MNGQGMLKKQPDWWIEVGHHKSFLNMVINENAKTFWNVQLLKLVTFYKEWFTILN